MRARSVVQGARLPILAVAASLVLASCGSLAQGSASDDTITLGAILSLTGENGSVGVAAQNGAKLAVEEINKSGGVLDRDLEIEYKDSQGDPAQAVQLFSSFARQQSVMGVVGPIFAPEMGAITKLAASTKMVVFSPISSGTVPGVDGGKFNEWTFRVNQPIPTIAGPLMTKVVGMVGADRVTILNAGDAAAYVDEADRWEEAAKKAEAEVQRIQFATGTADWSSIVTKVDGDADIIAIASVPADDGPLIQALRQAGHDAQLVGDSSFADPSTTELSRGGVSGAYLSSTFLPGFGTGTQKFIDSYQAEYGNAPNPLAAYGYETIKLVAKAFEDKGTVSRAALRDGLGGISGYQGLTGEISYDGSGDARRAEVPLVRIAENGSLERADTIPLDH